MRGVDRTRSHALAELEDGLHDAQLGGGGVEATNSHPVIDDHSGANNGATAVHTAGDERHLQQRAELVLVLDAGLRVHDTTSVAEAHVATRQHIVGDRLAEDFHTQHVGDDLFRLALQIGMHERDVVVGADDVSEG